MGCIITVPLRIWPNNVPEAILNSVWPIARRPSCLPLLALCGARRGSMVIGHIVTAYTTSGTHGRHSH
jgi:hypothetical protein